LLAVIGGEEPESLCSVPEADKDAQDARHRSDGDH
jgi:hypothetical protein